jgi:potassium-transporting ATPase KdpC subunit
MKDVLASLRCVAVFTVLFGIGYPVVVGGVALLMPDGGHGALELVGRSFDDDKYFWGRLSSVSNDAMTSSGTNAGPSGFVDNAGTLGPNPALVAAARARIRALRAADPTNTAKVPVDLVTASASGLDPHISPAAAYYQVGRVARARGVSPQTVRALVDAHVEPRTLGILGERRVNVLLLNRALDRDR